MRFALALISVLIPAAALLGQSPASTPPSVDRGVVKISTALIQLDVSITDQRGRLITDIRPEEIEVFENGVKQQISNFSFVSNPRKQSPKPEKADRSKPPIPEPPLVLRPEQVRRTIALVVDDLTLSFETANFTRRALRNFVDEQMQDGDLVAVIRTGAGIGALQQFTSDKRQLYAAIERVKWNASASGRVGSFDPIEPTQAETNKSLEIGPDVMSGTDAEDQRLEKIRVQSDREFRESVFTTGTLGALRYIVNGMAELPGRKSVMLFTNGISMVQRDELGGTQFSRIHEFLRELVREANRKTVLFYTFDARGLEYTGLTAADRPVDPAFAIRNPDFGPPAMEQSVNDRGAQIFDSQGGLIFLAKETGGLAYINQNDMSRGIDQALEDQSYYLVGYVPDVEVFDPAKARFNKIEVRVNRDAVLVRHRSGFFVGSDEKAIVVDTNYPTKVMRALTSPFALNGITVRLNTLFGHSQKTGYFIHSFLHIDGDDLVFNEKDGEMTATFDILAISYGDNGAPVDKINLVGSTKVRPEHLERAKRDGVAYSFIFPLKKPGALQMRIAVMDRASGEVGSANTFIDVPNLKKEGVLLSGILLENISKKIWTDVAAGNPRPGASDPRYSTAIRRFGRGTVLRFGGNLMNVKAAGVRLQGRVFHERKLVFEGPERILDPTAVNTYNEGVFNDAIELGEKLLPGDYVLQVVVTDAAAKAKRRIATQYVQFEVIE